jgi:hypothetical protein
MKTLYTFDVDETLFKTNAKIHVLQDGERVKSLSNTEFNTYKLGSNQTYDFSEFEDSKKFYNDSLPIYNMIDRVKAIHKHKDSADKIIILTARADMDNKEIYLNKFRESGLKIDDIHVHRAGNLKCSGGVAVKKAKVISEHIEKYDFSKIYLYDDAIDNLTTFLELKITYPSVKFYGYLVNCKGNVNLINTITPN